jgi:hypothetical protein
MRFKRFGLPMCVLLLSIPASGKQPSQSASTPQPASDPQAVAVVQAAITALGGATAISQPQSWTFQATLQGSIANSTVSYTLGQDAPNRYVALPNGTKKRMRRAQSLFVPALIGPVLLAESQDSELTLRFAGKATIDSKSVTVICFSVTAFPNVTSQTWWFDDTTGLPRRVEFQLPAEMGSRISFSGLFDLLDYHSVFGISYPFQIITLLGGRPPEFTTIQSVASSGSAPTTYFDALSGDSL